MKAEASTETVVEKRDCSWRLLGVTSISFLVALWLLSYVVYYTEGEVGQILFRILIGITALCVAVGFFHRFLALWLVVIISGILISWQSYQACRLAVLRKEAGEFINYVDGYHAEHGKYPDDISGYKFKHKSMESHIHRYSLGRQQGYYFEYFLDSPSLTYRYTPGGGHRYYPD